MQAQCGGILCFSARTDPPSPFVILAAGTPYYTALAHTTYSSLHSPHFHDSLYTPAFVAPSLGRLRSRQILELNTPRLAARCDAPLPLA